VPIFESLGQQTPNIEPIQEVYSFEKDTNESMINENNYFINNDNFSEKSFDILEPLSSSSPLYSLEHKFISNSNTQKFDSTYDESFNISKFRKNIFKIHSCNSNTNKSEMNIREVLQLKTFKQQNKNTSYSTPNNSNNLSCNLTIISNDKSDKTDKLDKKRGRKKFFPEGIKREVQDKAFLRQFKLYLRESKVFKNYKVDPEEKLFWTEFSQNNNPPIKFTIGNQKVEYKSFSSNLMKYIFSHSSVRALYDQFAKETHLIRNLLEKKIKNVNDLKIKKYYCLYGSNMHKLYGMENSVYSGDLFDLINNTMNTNMNYNMNMSVNYNMTANNTNNITNNIATNITTNMVNNMNINQINHNNLSLINNTHTSQTSQNHEFDISN